jgi:hypothetical protein
MQNGMHSTIALEFSPWSIKLPLGRGRSTISPPSKKAEFSPLLTMDTSRFIELYSLSIEQLPLEICYDIQGV